MSARHMVVVAHLISLLVLAACDTPAPTATGRPDVYTVRVKIVEVTGTGENTRATVQHEAIPAFKDRDGFASTMPAMTMAFGLEPEVDKSALKAGTMWTVTFDVVWLREPALRIFSATPLPAETKLTLAN